MARILVIGANGQLGTDLVKTYQASSDELVPVTHAQLDVCDAREVDRALAAVAPDVVINTAAFHKLEACEEQIERAFAVNCFAARSLGQSCERIGAHLVHVSTDYVFGGEQRTPYPEDAPLNPATVYGTSKAAGEYFIRNLCRRHLIIRTSGLYGLAGSSGKGGNFVETMLRLGRETGTVSVVSDQVLSPTYTADLAEMVRRLVDARAQGVFHVTNSEFCSWYEFARTIFELAGETVEVTPTLTPRGPRDIKRPAFSALANHRLRDEGFGLLHPWRLALNSYLQARVARPVPVG